MVNVTICRNDKLILSATIEGHANSDKYGKDLVCAAVSAISVGTINALEELCGYKPDIETNDGFIHVKFRKDNESQLIAKTMVAQLKSVEESNKSYLKIIYC